jgi:hypothetical protein
MAIFTRAATAPTYQNGSSNNITITKNYFGGFINSIFFIEMVNSAISYNYFDSNASCTGNHGETINPGGGNINVSIYHNFFNDPYVSAIGGHKWGGSNDYIYIYNNIFKGNYAVTGKSVNMIIGNENDPDDDMFCHTYVYNNTFTGIDVVAYGIMWFGPLRNCSPAVVRNNLFYRNTGSGFQYGGGNNADHDYNFYSNNSNTVTEPHGVTNSSNPFNNYSGGDYSLITGSSAIDRGTAPVAFSISTDYIGTSRPKGYGFDIGAFEFISSPSSKLPNFPLIIEVR